MDLKNIHTVGSKEIIRSIALAVSCIAICVTLWLVTKRFIPGGNIPDGKILVEQSFLDSLRAVAEMPPDTTYIEKIIIKDTTIFIVTANPTPIYIDTTTDQRVYVDSVKMLDDGINAWVEVRTKGIVESIIWGYKPVINTITKEIRIPQPYPVELIKYQPQRGLFLLGGVGGGGSSVGFSLGLLWQQKNGLTYGLETLQMDQRFYMIKIGFKIL